MPELRLCKLPLPMPSLESPSFLVCYQLIHLHIHCVYGTHEINKIFFKKDMTPEEFKSKVLMTNVPAKTITAPVISSKAADAAPPASFDWYC